MKIIFMGTPDFAVGTLEALCEAGHEVVLVVTQPDKPKGRGKNVQFSPVKECALAHGLEIFQPKRIREPENIPFLQKYNADVMVVAAFGQILPKEILDMTPYGCINVHGSLLPKYRGAAPIQWAVINGEEFAGVTIMQMDIGVDTGDMLTKREIRVAEDETGGSLFDRLAKVGAELLVETLDLLQEGKVKPVPQNPEEATHTRMISKEFGNIDWTRPAVEIERLVRGLNPWPSAFTSLDHKTFKIWKAKVLDNHYEAEPGAIVELTKDAIVVQTGEGALALLEVQLEGKKRMDAGSFMRGYALEVGTFFNRV